MVLTILMASTLAAVKLKDRLEINKGQSTARVVRNPKGPHLHTDIPLQSAEFGYRAVSIDGHLVVFPMVCTN